MGRGLTLLSLLILCAVQSGCSPPAIPSGASMHWDLKGGSSWTWVQQFEHGCVAWRATDDWAEVDVQTDSRCKTPRAWVDGTDPRIHYFTATERIVFKGYWPFGEMYSGPGPCPHQITESHIAELRVVANEALAEATTDGERRVLSRIVQRLSVLNGNALLNWQGWCSDAPQIDETGQDVWQSGR